MPRLSTSDQVKNRVAHLLDRLLNYANHELGNDDEFPTGLTVRWLDETSHHPKLVVQTKLKVLAKLVFPDEIQKTATEYIRHDLHLLRDFLKILEDNRTKTQGAELWHFTLMLWHKSTDRNLKKFEEHWQMLKFPLPINVQGSPAQNANQTVNQQIQRVPIASELDRSHPSSSSERSDLVRTNGASILPDSPGSDASNHLDQYHLVDRTNQTSIQSRHNLPSRNYTAFIGFKTPMTRLLKLLSFEHPAHVISIEGLGGSGKTTLILEAAYRCLRATSSPDIFPGLPHFDAVIFTSAQSRQFVGSHFLTRLSGENDLADIFRVILRTLDHFDSMPASLNEQLDCIRSSLARQQTLLIVDNLETLDDRDQVLAFLSELPPTVKLVVTSRVRLGLGTVIPLECLPPQEGETLIVHQAQGKGLELTPEQVQSIYRATAGLPLAIAYMIGQMAVYGTTSGIVSGTISGTPPGTVSGINPSAVNSSRTISDLARYCFEESVQKLRTTVAHLIIMGLAVFPRSACQDALAYVTCPDSSSSDSSLTDHWFAVKDGLSTLYQLSLVINTQAERWSLHSLTREYVQFELTQHPDFARAARERWLQWLLKNSEPYGAIDWQDWQDYTFLDQEWENLREAVAWCQVNNRYTDFQKLWHCLKGYTLFCGHWSERLDWMIWLMDTAEQCQDWAMVAEGAYHRSRTLTHLNPTDKSEAIALATRAWELASNQKQPFQFEVTIYLAILHIKCEDFDEALDWLYRGKILLQSSLTEEQRHVRQRCQIFYCQAEINFNQKNYEKAKELYREALSLAEASQFKRLQSYAQGWIGVILFQQGRLAEAEQVLLNALQIDQQNQDKRALAFCQYYLALTAQKRNDRNSLHHWATLAYQNFERLRMTTEAATMQALLTTI